jgi:hypothetical protein
MDFARLRVVEAAGSKPRWALCHRLVFFAELLTVSWLKPSQLEMKRYNQMAMVETTSDIKKNVTSISIFLSPRT